MAWLSAVVGYGPKLAISFGTDVISLYNNTIARKNIPAAPKDELLASILLSKSAFHAFVSMLRGRSEQNTVLAALPRTASLSVVLFSTPHRQKKQVLAHYTLYLPSFPHIDCTKA
jgi:hypothetical protein